MPRQAHGRSLISNGSSKARKTKPRTGRGLNALETAEREHPDHIKVRRHRLGEVEDNPDDSNYGRNSGERSAKRRKVDLTVDDVQSEDQGSDPDGRPWHVGVDEEDDDSDIDSDEAFGESDEERFADFTFRGSKTNPKVAQPSRKETKSRTLDLDEDMELSIDDGVEDDGDNSKGSEDESLGEDAVDLAAAWDIDDEEEEQEKTTAAAPKSGKTRIRRHSFHSHGNKASEQSVGDNGNKDSGNSEGSEGDDDINAYLDIDISEDDHDDETTTRLRDFVEGLTPSRQDVSSSRTEPRDTSSTARPSMRISAADLMQYVTDPTQRQSLKILQAAEREEPTKHRGGIPGKLSVPLAKRQQDRLDRVAAYDQTKQTLDRWVDTVKQNRRLEHLSFPQSDSAKASASAVKSFQANSRTAPQSDLEAKIQEIMQESGLNVASGDMAEREEQGYEELKEKRIPLDEVQARRRELRMQRELMFREEVRAKRIKKIKSKAYRRVHRKEKDRFAAHEHERLAAAGVLDSDEEREKLERRRAEERMGARHRESKWAKAAKATGQTMWNDDAKIGVSELARRDDELRRRIEGQNIRGSDDSSGETDSESASGSDSDAENVRWSQKLDRLEEAPVASSKSKLADMAFMKKADAERKAQNEEDLRSLRRAFEGEESMSESGSDAEEVLGQQKYGKPNRKQSKAIMQPIDRSEFDERISEDEEAERLEVHQASIRHNSKAAGSITAQNVQTSDLNSKPTFQMNETASLEPRSVKPSQASQSKPRTVLQNAKQQDLNMEEYTSPSESEDEQNDTLDEKDKLALEIFAGDDEEDLRKQFEKEKRQTVQDEGDQVIDNTLPGWGSWVGAGVSKREQKETKGRFVTVVKGIAPEARKDARLDRVIVNEKRVKKNNKYLATELPHPFESRQQYERSLRLPMGPEWSTRNHFQDAIKPRVLLKQGQIVKPLTRPAA